MCSEQLHSEISCGTKSPTKFFSKARQNYFKETCRSLKRVCFIYTSEKAI